MSSPAPARTKPRKKTNWQLWAAWVAVPVIVPLIGIYKPDSGGREKTPGNFTYIGSISVVENEIHQLPGAPAIDAALTARIQADVNLAKAGQFEANRPLFEQLAKEIPAQAILTSAGALNAESGNDQLAHEYYQKALAINPDYKAALTNMAALQTAKPEARSLSAGHEVEPNNDILHANILPLETAALGEIASPSDTDFFRITVESLPRDYYRISFKNLSTTLSPEMHVYDRQKNEVSADARDTPGSEFDHDFVPAPDSDYYTKVAPRGGTARANSLAVTPLHKYDRFEPNDDLASAKAISLGQTIEANIMDPGDFDFFQVKSAGVAGNLAITFRNLSSTFAPEMHVCDRQKNELFADARDTPDSEFEHVFLSQPNSTYFIRLSQRFGTAGGTDINRPR